MKTQHDEEVDKTESKQIHDDVSKAAQQLPVSNIKQEPGLNDPEEHIGKKHVQFHEIFVKKIMNKLIYYYYC